MLPKFSITDHLRRPTTCLMADCIRRLNLNDTFNLTACIFTRRLTSKDNCNNEKLWNAFRACLYKNLKKQDFQPGNKVSIVGTGAVGMSCAITLLVKGVTNQLTLYDSDKEWSDAERMDLGHGSLFLHNSHIESSSCIDCTKDSRVVVVTAGERPKCNESRIQVAQATADILKVIMPELVKQSPKAVFLIVSNPADVMTWVARKVTNLPYERCFSTGCHLDSARFRFFISKLMCVSPSSVHAYVLGEHGDTSVPIWSSVGIGGVRFQSILSTIGTSRDPMQWSNVHEDVVKAAFKVISVKGYTNWAIGLTVTDVISAIFENSNRVLCLSTNAMGMCDIKEEIFMSLPCIVNEWGLSGIVRPRLTEWEKCMLKKSADVLLEAQCNIKI